MIVKEKIREAIESQNLVENYCDLDTQLQPNSFDLTVHKIYKCSGKGKLDFSNSEREIPDFNEISPVKENEEDKYGWLHLEEGTYKVKTNEKLNLPNDLVVVLFPRSSLLRVGCYTQQGLVDSGFSGSLEFVLVVGNQGLDLKQNARICQAVFMGVEETESYQGIHKDK